MSSKGKVFVAGHLYRSDFNCAPRVNKWSNISQIRATVFFGAALDEDGNVFISYKDDKIFSNITSIWAGYRTILAKSKSDTYSMYFDGPRNEVTVISDIVPPSDEISDFFIDEDVIIGIINEGDSLLVYENDLTLRMNEYEKIDAPEIYFTNGLTTISLNGIWVYIDTLGEIVGIRDFEPLKMGSRGAMVKALQSMLVQFGYNCEQNGVLDKITQESAVDLMQRLNITSTKNIEESFFLALMNMI